jgi:hypothetical protein
VETTFRRANPNAEGQAARNADTAEWQAAIEALMLVAESGGPTMFARIGIMNHGEPDPAIVPQGKRAKVYKVIR